MKNNKELERYFKVFKKTKLTDIEEGQVIPTSDFSLVNDNDEIVQFEYHDNRPDESDVVLKPGIFTLKEDRYREIILTKTNFTENNVLEDYTFTKEIGVKINRFFSKQHIYKKYKSFPKRSMLLYGKPGTGKTMSIIETVKQYAKNSTILVWPTNKFRAGDVKDFLKDAKYESKNLFLIVEDIGGVEYEGQKMAVDSGMLSLLDNMEQTFTKPTYIIATTNYPENLLDSLTDRPQRFDDVIEVPPPNEEQRVKLLEFFAKDLVKKEPEILEELRKTKYEGLTVAHIKDIPIRAELYDMKLIDVLAKMKDDREKVKEGFSKTSSMGF